MRSKKNFFISSFVLATAFTVVYVKLKYFTDDSKYSLHKDENIGFDKIFEVDHANSTYHGDVSFIQIVIATDSEQFPGVSTLLNSLIKHVDGSYHVTVHVIVSEKKSELVKQLTCSGLMNKMKINVTLFELPDDVKNRIFVTAKKTIYGNLSSPANFVRFFLHILFPSLSHVIYIDVDSLILHDISELWKEVVYSDQLITATAIPKRYYSSYLKSSVVQLYYERYGRHLDLSTPCIMAGLFGVNLDMWRDLKLHDDVVYWMTKHSEQPLWTLGSQPILMIIAYGRWNVLNEHWNLSNLGWKTGYTLKELSEAYILHWNGKGKPWLPSGLYSSIWKSYTPNICSNNGKCLIDNREDVVCQCNDLFTGILCDEIL